MHDNIVISRRIHRVIFLNAAWKSPVPRWMIIRMVPSQDFLSAVRRKGSSQTEVVRRCSFWSVFYRNVHGFSFFWGPQDRSLGLYGLADPARSSHDCYVKRYDELAVDAENSSSPGQRIGPAHKICPMQFDDGWHELEYFVAYDQALDAIAEVRQVMKRHPDQAFPMEVRAIAADSAWMSPMSGRDSVSISVSGVAGTDYWRYLNDVDSSLIEFNGRAHWGKLHFMDAERLAKLYPHFSDFVGLRRSLDPHGLFLNDHIASLVS